MNYSPINVNPIKNGLYKWGNITVLISPDASKVVIKDETLEKAEVVVTGNFFQDVLNVIEGARKELSKGQAGVILFNTIATSRSLPTCGWD